MRILELVILVILFLGAIKDTPNRLSEKLFERKIQKAKEQSEKAVSEAKKSVSSQESANITSSAIENMRKLSLTFVYFLLSGRTRNYILCICSNYNSIAVLEHFVFLY